MTMTMIMLMMVMKNKMVMAMVMIVMLIKVLWRSSDSTTNKEKFSCCPPKEFRENYQII